MRSNDKSIGVSRNILVNEACANIDFKYGPYHSTQEAFDKLEDLDALAVGLTVGILESDGSISEYWFKKKCEEHTDLVPKTISLTIEEKEEIAERVAELIPSAKYSDIMQLF